MNKNRVTPTNVGEDRAFCAEFSRTNTSAEFFVAIKKKKRLLKVIGASSLAFFMGIGTLCGVLIAPTTAVQANAGGETFSAQEKLLAGADLGFDPENDPVVFTTDYGLEIKSHNAAGLPDIAVNDPTGNGTVTVSKTTWNYISAGGYNWIIIGQYSNTSYSYNPGTVSADIFSGNNPDGTDAGNTIESASNNGLLQSDTMTFPAFTNAVVPSNGEIPGGCVLCLCATTVGETCFNTETALGNNYSDSNLQDYMDNTVYGSTSTLSAALQALPIVPQTLTTLYYPSNVSTIESAYVFPLAGRSTSESFYVATYLDATKRNINKLYWVRSGDHQASTSGFFVRVDGSLSNDARYVTYKYGHVRPAFVLRLYGS